MSAAPLPAGYRIRRPAVDDAPAIYRLLAACDIAAIGFPDVTEEDVRDAFAEPDYDPDTDGWLGYADYAWALRRGSSGAVDIDF